VKYHSSALDHVPEILMTAELCLLAVKEHDDALLYVPENLMTVELCLEAMKEYSYAYALQSVLDDPMMVEIYLKEETLMGCNMYIPARICLEVVKANGMALHLLAEELRTAEVCLEAVKQDGGALIDVPENLKTAELCFKALKSMIEKHVPEALREEVRRRVASSLANRESGADSHN
jgi:hypothetical protein